MFLIVSKFRTAEHIIYEQGIVSPNNKEYRAQKKHMPFSMKNVYWFTLSKHASVITNNEKNGV